MRSAHPPQKLDVGVLVTAIPHRGILGAGADPQHPLLVDEHRRRGHILVVGVLDDLGIHSIQHRNSAVGCSQIDSKVNGASVHGIS